MASEFKVGDRVSRAGYDSGVVPVGALGTVINGDAIMTTVRWDHGFGTHPYTAEYLELHSPAPAQQQCGACGFIGGNCCLACTTRPGNPQAQQRQQHWTQTLEPAAAVKVCSSECEAARGRLRQLESDNRSLGMRLGDALGDRDVLRSRVAELEAALGFAERELCRMRKAGRR